MTCQCVFCNSFDNLNTTMNLNIDGNEVAASICDNHASKATVKSVKAAYIKRMDKINSILKQAKAFGLELVSKEQRNIVPVARVNQIKRPSSLQGDNVVSTDKLDKFNRIPNVRSSSDVPASLASPIDLKSIAGNLPEGVLNGHAEMALVEGRQGQPMPIPKVRVDGIGTTTITVLKKTDRDLQNRFRQIAEQSMHDQFSDGYEDNERTCPICRGSGTIRNQNVNKSCTKCGGLGIIKVL